jgi:hypothetical protein
MDNLLECSKRTVSKRLKCECSNCGWNLCRGDLHHIIPTSKGGDDTNKNITYLCPNCHRAAHQGLISNLKSIDETIGDKWKEFYNVSPRTGKPRVWVGKREHGDLSLLEFARQTRQRKCTKLAMAKIADLEEADLDKTVYGWIQKASEILKIAPQSVQRYLKKYKPSYLDGAKTRKNRSFLREKL